MQPSVYPGAAPYQRSAPVTYPQTLPQQPKQQVTTLPRPQMETPKPSQPVFVEVLPPTTKTAFLPVEVPSPSQLGIRLENHESNAIVVPDPAKLGIRGY